MIKYNFEKLTKIDSLRVQKVMSKAFKVRYLDESDEKEEQKYIESIISSPNNRVYGIEQEQNLIAASYCLKLDNNIYEVSRIMVLPNQQKQKIGSYLLDKTIQELRKENVKIVLLECQKDVLPFYQKNGFQEIDDKNSLSKESTVIRKKESLQSYISEGNIESDNTKIVGRRI